jgi:hypothetical protein
MDLSIKRRKLDNNFRVCFGSGKLRIFTNALGWLQTAIGNHFAHPYVNIQSICLKIDNKLHFKTAAFVNFLCALDLGFQMILGSPN